ncbi:hypothetical protein [Nonomuraea endophytica]|uniref:Uncharacterized protein n=1 Tax=Nonomuraea endophytica TaxID=714136 RepID=A0A7W8EM45_9ACTN|nr:hypothetical protein [Nonomuraea endophytica]MBB5083562.1 hypothetical protein [Nonomuraea endophytica]
MWLRRLIEDGVELAWATSWGSVEIWTEVGNPIAQVLTTHNALTTVSGGSQG